MYTEGGMQFVPQVESNVSVPGVRADGGGGGGGGEE